MNPKKFISQKGVSLLLTILVMAALLSIAIGLARLTLGEIKLVRDIPVSLVAYYAAETGVEEALFQEWQTPEGAHSSSDCLANNSCYVVSVERTGSSVKVTSVGSYQNTKRSIEVSF